MNKQEKIESVKQGWYAWRNDGTFQQLRGVLKMMFPNEPFEMLGIHKFYYVSNPSGHAWDSSDTTDLPVHSIKELFASGEAVLKVTTPMNNQEKIKSVRQGLCVWYNDGTVEQLREVLNMSFPNDSWEVNGDCKFYYTQKADLNSWFCNDTTILPSHSIKDFFNSDEAEIKVGDNVEWEVYTIKVIHIHKDQAWIESDDFIGGQLVSLSALKKVKSQDQKDREKIAELMWIGYTSNLKFGLDLIKYARESK